MRKPRKPITLTVACRLRQDEIARLNAIAAYREWSLSKVVRKAIEQFLESAPLTHMTQLPGAGSRAKTRLAIKRVRKGNPA